MNPSILLYLSMCWFQSSRIVVVSSIQDIVVERKSISDLIGSFASGRLYTQCDAMCRYYKSPMLLIEFDEQKPFTLHTHGAVSTYHELSATEITTKLSVLALHFPRLRMLWMRSPYATADIFAALQATEPLPDPIAAAGIGSAPEEGGAAAAPGAVAGQHRNGEFGGHQGRAYNWLPQEILRRLPGVTPHNVYNLMRRVESLQSLAKLSTVELVKILGPMNGKKLHEFLHTSTARFG